MGDAPLGVVNMAYITHFSSRKVVLAFLHISLTVSVNDLNFNQTQIGLTHLRFLLSCFFVLILIHLIQITVLDAL